MSHNDANVSFIRRYASFFFQLHGCCKNNFPPPPFPFFYHLKICIVTYMYKVVPVLARGRVLFQYAYTLACSFGIRPQLDLVGT